MTFSNLVLTAVACYDGASCGDKAVEVETISDCCQNVSVLKSYIVSGDVSTCNPCLGKV